MNRKDRRIAAKTGGANAISNTRTDPAFDLGLTYHQMGNLQDAERAYREVLSRNPRHGGALNYLGILGYQSGHHDDAAILLRKALAVDSKNPELHFNLGLVYTALQRDDDAIAENRAALALMPNHIGAHINLGSLLLHRGQIQDAKIHFATACELDPRSPLVYDNYAKTLLVLGEGAKALDVATSGMAIARTPELSATFLRALPFVSSLPDNERTRLRIVLLRAMKEFWFRPSDLAHATTELLPADDDALLNDELLLELLSATPNTNRGLERRLARLRQSALSGVLSSPNEHIGKFCFLCALAQQCFINEYVFAVSAEETAALEKLSAQAAAALRANSDTAHLLMATLACYAPLSEFQTTYNITADMWPRQIAPIINQQISDVQREAQLKLTIPTLAAIEDDVSLKVQEQYEDNAYPRWRRTSQKATPVPIDHYVRSRVPGAAFHALGDRPLDVLIAGCGTGRQAVEQASNYKANKVTAIDLSRSSIAYAMRKTEEAGLKHLHYAQADILKLDTSIGPFDVIESVGVLHHLRDPLEGWRKLLALLKPGGLMLVALYSTHARKDVRDARAFIQSRKLDATAEGVRGFRQTVFDLPPDNPLQNLLGFSDFYTVSECRDLVFHVQEHQFGIPQISAFIAEQNLQFIGFETLSSAKYLSRFPNDPAATNLDNWNTFEIENPSTFAAMYVFWIQKPE